MKAIFSSGEIRMRMIAENEERDEYKLHLHRTHRAPSTLHGRKLTLLNQQDTSTMKVIESMAYRTLFLI